MHAMVSCKHPPGRFLCALLPLCRLSFPGGTAFTNLDKRIIPHIFCATLAVPSLYEQSILFRFCVILLAGLFGVLGLTCAALMILAMACGSEPFGYDYLYPLMPPGKASVRDGFVRSIWSELAKAGEVIGHHEM